MAFCSNCGAQLLPETKFCAKCGTAVEAVLHNNVQPIQPEQTSHFFSDQSTQHEQAAQPPVQAEFTPQQTIPAPQPVYHPHPVTAIPAQQRTKPGNSNLVNIVMLIGVLVGVALLFVWLFLPFTTISERMYDRVPACGERGWVSMGCSTCNWSGVTAEGWNCWSCEQWHTCHLCDDWRNWERIYQGSVTLRITGFQVIFGHDHSPNISMNRNLPNDFFYWYDNPAIRVPGLWSAAFFLFAPLVMMLIVVFIFKWSGRKKALLGLSLFGLHKAIFVLTGNIDANSLITRSAVRYGFGEWYYFNEYTNATVSVGIGNILFVLTWATLAILCLVCSSTSSKKCK